MRVAVSVILFLFLVPLASSAWAEDGAALETELGLTRADRRVIQTSLSAQGFDPGPADGVFGRRTRAAISRWQGARGEEPTGYLNAETARLLIERPPQLPEVTTSAESVETALGLTREDRRAIQSGLAARGFDPGPADGLFGARTRAAIGRWQAGRGAEPTGYLDAEAARSLLAPVSEQRAVGTPEPDVSEEDRHAETEAQRERQREQREAEAEAERERQRQEREAEEETERERQSQQREAEAERRRRDRQPGARLRDCETCPQLVVVPAGSFTMGSPDSEWGRFANEGPQRQVTITEPLAVGVYEVTFEEWDACVNAGGCDGYEPKGEGWGRGDRPVINVSWDDARAYVDWLSLRTGQRYRLLSESEWEYVARAGTLEPFHTGFTISAEQANYDSSYTYGSGQKGRYRGRTVQVGTFSPNAFGLHEVHGNVWEWTQDCWNEDYTGAPTNGVARETGECEQRVLRGGSWGDVPWLLRSADRGKRESGIRGPKIGFRIARPLGP
ncbi:MAG: SUMF1/EgtB/PvdO family nonheme iron enzyme [Candidatus Tectomicrobia bacterium]|nr:SUMF1/EgtB/PvdO family nonheme iron enzyme [Candidatus Tectomicrobia bacterium]